MSMQARPEIPCHFGADQSLFGLYHAAPAPSTPAVLLCPPLGQDAIRCHRLYRQLGHALASQGTPVLRFDYYGTGDSAGDSAELDWYRCVADTCAAAAQLRARSGSERVIAFGARLGAAIAIAASDSAQWAGMVVWDPVLDGAAHVARLDALQTALRCDTERFIAVRPAADAANQWQGFPISADWRRQLAALQLPPPRVPALLLHSWPPHTSDDRARFAEAGAGVRVLSDPTPWEDLARLELAIQSRELIEFARDYIRELH